MAQSLKSVTPSPTATGPKHDQTQSLSAFLASPPRGWKLVGADVPLTLDKLSKNFKNPSQMSTVLSLTGYLRGIDRAYVQQSPRRVVDAELWQFAAPAGGDEFFQFLVKGNTPHPGSLYTLMSDAPDDGHIFIGAHPDSYGFNFGVGVRRIGDVIVHVRYASLAPVKVSDVSSALQRMVTSVLASPSAV